MGKGNTNALGDGANEMGDNLTPIDFGSGLEVTDMSCGGSHCCALLSNARLKCFGGNNAGVLGLGDTANRGAAGGEMGDSLPYVPLD